MEKTNIYGGELKKIISAQDIEIVNADDPRAQNGATQRMLAHLSKKLDLDYSYIYAMYCELFPGISPVAFMNDEALGYVATVMSGYMNFKTGKMDPKNAFIFIKQWAVATDYAYSKCEVVDDTKGNNSVMQMLTSHVIEMGSNYGIDKYLVTIAESNTASTNLAKRTAAINGLEIYSPGRIVCTDTVKKNGVDTSEDEIYWVMARDPEKAVYELKEAGYLQNMVPYSRTRK